LTLSKANVVTLANAYGLDAEGWIGKKVQLEKGELPNQDGELVAAAIVVPLTPPLTEDELVAIAKKLSNDNDSTDKRDDAFGIKVDDRISSGPVRNGRGGGRGSDLDDDIPEDWR
jgi:hypothetical protein